MTQNSRHAKIVPKCLIIVGPKRCPKNPYEPKMVQIDQWIKDDCPCRGKMTQNTKKLSQNNATSSLRAQLLAEAERIRFVSPIARIGPIWQYSPPPISIFSWLLGPLFLVPCPWWQLFWWCPCCFVSRRWSIPTVRSVIIDHQEGDLWSLVDQWISPWPNYKSYLWIVPQIHGLTGENCSPLSNLNNDLGLWSSNA